MTIKEKCSLSELLEKGYRFNITNNTVYSKDIKENPPTLKSLSGKHLDDDEFEYISSILKNSDEKMYAPNGFHTLGYIKDMLDDEYIKKQVDSIINSASPCQLIWYLEIIPPSFWNEQMKIIN